jgi:hypothetical protein
MTSRLGVILMLLMCASAVADDLTNRYAAVDVRAPFDEYLAAKPLLVEYAGATVIKLADGRRVILSVASTTVNDDSAKDRLRMRKVCRSKALANVVAEAKGIQVVSESKVEDRTQVIIEDGKETARSIEDVLEVSRTTVEGLVSNLPVVGTWYSKDRTLFYLAVGIVMDKKGATPGN